MGRRGDQSVGQNLILPFILLICLRLFGRRSDLSRQASVLRLGCGPVFPLFGSSCPPAQGLPKSRLPAQSAAEGPEHQGAQAERGDVGQGSGMAKVLPFPSDQKLEGSLLVQMPNRRLRDNSERVQVNRCLTASKSTRISAMTLPCLRNIHTVR